MKLHPWSREVIFPICMEIDLEKPLISKFQLKRKVRKIEYEGIHLVSFSYGKFNYRNDECFSE